MRALLAVIDRVATGLFVNCEAIREHLVHDWKVSRKRIHVCYNGVETNEFHASGRSRPASLADASVVIGTVAVLREEKNLPALIQAFAGVHKVDPRAKLLIVGSGPMKQELERQAASLGVAEAAVFEEASAAPAQWMRAIDVFALPSRSEAFSNALLEAMACGCCPIGSRIGGTPELIAEGERGLLFEPGNTAAFTEKLTTLATDESLRRRMGEASAKFVSERLNIEVASARLASIYTSLLKA
jgi:L-malate glycosyltransferase